MIEGVRLDKWLWCARLFKTRSLAAEACQAGKVKVREHAAKPSHELKPGEVITVQLSHIKKTVEVVGLVRNRVSPPQVPDVYTDLTPPEVYEQLQFKKEFGFEQRDRGIGRPTKKERRQIIHLKDLNQP
jgi:ribosome-associated heat shock protein Hsp15